MAHELELINNQVPMFSVKATPWHRLGVVLPQAPTIAEAIKAAGLDWTVGLKPLITVDGQDVPAQATFRESDGQILGVVGPTYKPLQNIEAFNFFQPFIDSGMVELETAGALRGGKRVWVLAKVKGAAREIVPGDAVELYVLLSNSHDGTLAVRAGFTPIRVVCNNTLTGAHSDRASKLIRVRHTGNVVANLDKIREIMNLATGEFEATVSQYKSLSRRSVNQADIEKFVKIVFGQKGNDTAGARVLPKIQELFQAGRGNDMEGVKGTMWALYNAATEYIQYERGKDEQVRLDSTWFGQGAQLNKKALEAALNMVAA